MAKDLTELISQKPELFKTAIRLPDVTRRVLAMVMGIQKYGERIGIRNPKHIRISGPSKAMEPYDIVYKIGRKAR
jgi:hypothetical protein